MHCVSEANPSLKGSTNVGLPGPVCGYRVDFRRPGPGIPASASHLVRTIGLAAMPFSLLQLSNPELEDLAASRVPASLSSRVEQGALPPAFVAARSLDLQASGHPEPWSTSFLIVRNGDDRIVGACGFKTAPSDGRVEIGYGVSAAARGQGAATQAVELLIALAFSAGAKSVLAEIVPDNHASARVVKKNGFTLSGAQNDKNGEYVVQWVRASEA